MPIAYDPNNIFAKILRGEAPCARVYEDAQALAFMDIMPRAEGHLLVIPKSPARTILEFRDILNEHGVIATTRRTRGDDIDAACGQLAGKVTDRTQTRLGAKLGAPRAAAEVQ